jgi:hypothetical protein
MFSQGTDILVEVPWTGVVGFQIAKVKIVKDKT